jgi:predicted acetyltransferase
MIQLFEFPSNDLIGELSSQIHALLSGAWPEDAPNEGDYYRTYGAPTAVLVIRSATDVLAHLAIYQRQVDIGEETLEIGMLGGIVVATEHRRKGYSRTLVQHAHEWLKGRYIPFSILFTHEPRLYTSSGYQLMQNATRFVDIDGTLKTLLYTGGMYAELSQRRWPDQMLDLRGRVV